MSILDHPEWPTVKWCLRLEYYGRDPRPDDEDEPRHRVELRTHLPPELEQHLLALVSPCVHCGKPMSPIRQRTGGGAAYFAATCADGLQGACSKGKAASDEYERIKQALNNLDGTPPHGLGWLPF